MKPYRTEPPPLGYKLDRLVLLATGVVVIAITAFASAPPFSSGADDAASTHASGIASHEALNPSLLLLNARVCEEAQYIRFVGVPHRFIEFTFGDSTRVLVCARVDFWTTSVVDFRVITGVHRQYTRAINYGLTLADVCELVESEQVRAVSTPFHLLLNNCRSFVERFMSALEARAGGSPATAPPMSATASSSMTQVASALPVVADPERLERLDLFTAHLLTHAAPAVVAAAVVLATAGRAAAPAAEEEDAASPSGFSVVPSSLSINQ